ncbi:EamA family transporter [Virgibacillus salinus]|uniref:Threonine/homoserine efflux transporter RhtA n=2 Tax=Virgibacillus TaxID=84406 RepID=A0A1H0Y5X4_9BACI|nr:DMT family transporter [Virgibacillus salinus]SDQ10366.1 Threonine/homoserine efflux transporter RhtA [Virgibacillus salinus]
MGDKKGIFFVLIGAGSFGFTPVFAKLGFSNGYTLGQINIVQMLISLVLLWGIVIAKRSSFRGLNKKNIKQIMITGSFVGLTSIFYYGSMIYLPASLAIILLFQFVWIGILFEWILSKVTPSLVTLLAMALILIGVFFASNILNGSLEKLPAMGFVFGILAAFTYAGFINFSGKVAIEVDPWVRSSLMVTGSTVLVILIFIKDIPSIPVTDGSLWIVTAGVALFGSVMPPLFFALGAHLISGGLVNILSSFELPVAIISASIILSESITLVQWLGTFLIIVAIILNELGSMRLYHRKHSASD